jgi:hypothetical protein
MEATTSDRVPDGGVLGQRMMVVKAFAKRCTGHPHHKHAMAVPRLVFKMGSDCSGVLHQEMAAQ